MLILSDSSLSTFLLFPISAFLLHLCICVCVSAQYFLCSSVFYTSFFLILCVQSFTGSLADQLTSLWVLLIYYSINYSSINSVIALLLSVPASIHIPHNQCPIHPISPYSLAVLVTYLFHHSSYLSIPLPRQHVPCLP